MITTEKLSKTVESCGMYFKLNNNTINGFHIEHIFDLSIPTFWNQKLKSLRSESIKRFKEY